MRRFKHCEWCNRTIDVTNNGNDLCASCARFHNHMDMLKYTIEHPEELGKANRLIYRKTEYVKCKNCGNEFAEAFYFPYNKGFCSVECAETFKK